MSTFEVLPYEISEYIWFMLELSDLLSCMAVCSSWRKKITCSTLWRRLCQAKTIDDSSTWYEVFLNESKKIWAWRMGIFNDEFEIDDCMLFCCSQDFIYVISQNNIFRKYNLDGQIIKEIKATGQCINMYIIKDDIALLFSIEQEKNEVAIFNSDLEELFRFSAYTDLVCTSSDRLWVRSARDNASVTVYYSKNDRSDRYTKVIYISPDTSLMPVDNGWCTKMIHGEVHLVYDDYTKTIYKCDQTPMSRLFLSVHTNNKDTVAVIDKKFIAGKHFYCTVFIYQNGIKKHRADIPKNLKYWCFSGQYLVLVSRKEVCTINLITGKLYTEDIKDVEHCDNIYNVQNLYDHPTVALVILDRNFYFNVFDVKQHCNLITVDCVRERFMMESNTLICVPNMFVYAHEPNKIKVKTICLE